MSGALGFKKVPGGFNILQRLSTTGLETGFESESSLAVYGCLVFHIDLKPSLSTAWTFDWYCIQFKNIVLEITDIFVMLNHCNITSYLLYVIRQNSSHLRMFIHILISTACDWRQGGDPGLSGWAQWITRVLIGGSAVRGRQLCQMSGWGRPEPRNAGSSLETRKGKETESLEPSEGP